MENQQKLRRSLTDDESNWLNSHPECLCVLTSPLFAYGAIKVYDLRKCSCKKPDSFFDDFIVVFVDNKIEIWGVSSIQVLSNFVKDIRHE